MPATWESTVTTDVIEEFKVYYQDHAILMKDLNKRFGWGEGASTAHNVARRLGLPVRQPTYSKGPKPIPTPPVDLDTKIADLERQLEAAKMARAQQGVRFFWIEDLDLSQGLEPYIRQDVLIILGVTKDFRRLEGIPRLGKFLAETKGY